MLCLDLTLLTFTVTTRRDYVHITYFAGTQNISATKESHRVYVGTCNQNSSIDSV